MNSSALIHLINVSESEKKFIRAFVDKYGIDELINHIEKAKLSNRSKYTLLQIDQVIHNKGAALESIAALTEIPLGILKEEKVVSLHDFLDHPEWLNMDSRQFYRFRCVSDVFNSYHSALEQKRINKVYEELQYEPEG